MSDDKISKFFYIVLGIAVSFYGLRVIFYRGYISEKFRAAFDFGEYHYVWGGMILVWGVYIVLKALKI
ncbi:hypothetical protein QSV34_12935 [Porticoccus sp. W117]|uniref:hypothetical protein n=1 Tax=Porticoccus sp. W117 TaxID=3054777 RepID=UPI00259386CA|nr:hypothetical protein [Porticoccus sp. W117]MDM3872253.1 hypothetical protein [Porticoccus sp. W117]